jgi:hypothetical protein
MNSKILILTLVPGLFIAAGLQAADAILTFDEMDRDSNGYISLDEAKATNDIANNFKQIDTNDNGNINITEFQNYMGKGRNTPPEEMEIPEPGAAPY